MADAVTYLANLKVNEKKSPVQKQPALPVGCLPLAERGRLAMDKIMALRRDLSAASMELMDVMQYATHHGNVLALNPEQKTFPRSLMPPSALSSCA